MLWVSVCECDCVWGCYIIRCFMFFLYFVYYYLFIFIVVYEKVFLYIYSYFIILYNFYLDFYIFWEWSGCIGNIFDYKLMLFCVLVRWYDL